MVTEWLRTDSCRIATSCTVTVTVTVPELRPITMIWPATLGVRRVVDRTQDNLHDPAFGCRIARVLGVMSVPPSFVRIVHGANTVPGLGSLSAADMELTASTRFAHVRSAVDGHGDGVDRHPATAVDSSGCHRRILRSRRQFIGKPPSSTAHTFTFDGGGSSGLQTGDHDAARRPQ